MSPARRGLVIALAVVTACFAPHLFALGRFALGSDLYSHMLLLPFVSGYFIWTARDTFAWSAPNMPRAALSVAVAIAAICLYLVVLRSGAAREDRLAAGSLAMLCTYWAVLSCFLGWRSLAWLLFPVGILLFLIPLPVSVLAATEYGLQVGSAWCALVLFRAADMPLLYDNLVFQLPNFAMQVAPECSGIHSTLTLLITSIVAGRMFFPPGWKRWVLTLAVLPLGLIRNGLRIFVIGELCVRIGPHMIDSYIHEHGGPIFFAASLIPFGMLVWLLAKSRRIPIPEPIRPEKQPAAPIP